MPGAPTKLGTRSFIHHKNNIAIDCDEHDLDNVCHKQTNPFLDPLKPVIKSIDIPNPN